MLFRYPILIILLLAPFSGSAGEAVELHGGLLVNRAAGEVYLMQPAGGVAAVAVATGATRWRNAAADRPLDLQQNVLLLQIDTALAGRMDLARINVETGELEGTESVSLPKGVIPLVDQGLGQEFDHRRSAAGDLVWEYRTRPARGMPSEQPPPVQRQVGALSLGGATVSSIAPPDAQAVTDLWRARSPEVSSAAGGNDGRRFRAAGGLETLVSREDPGAPYWDRYEWTVFSDDGKILGRTRSHMSYSPFVVLEGMLLFVTQPLSRRTDDQGLISQPLMLRAIDLESGQEAWARELRDTRYQGPYPV